MNALSPSRVSDALASTVGMLTDDQLTALYLAIEIERAGRHMPLPALTKAKPATVRKPRGMGKAGKETARLDYLRDVNERLAYARANPEAPLGPDPLRPAASAYAPWTMNRDRMNRVQNCLAKMRMRKQHATREAKGTHGEVGSQDCGPVQFRGRVARLRAIYNNAILGA